MIQGVINTGETHCMTIHMTGKQVVDKRNQLREAAFQFLKENNVDHIIYYSDIRDEEGNILKANFYYNMIGLDDVTFYNRTRHYNGFVGAVHKH